MYVKRLDQCLRYSKCLRTIIYRDDDNNNHQDYVAWEGYWCLGGSSSSPWPNFCNPYGMGREDWKGGMNLILLLLVRAIEFYSWKEPQRYSHSIQLISKMKQLRPEKLCDLRRARARTRSLIPLLVFFLLYYTSMYFPNGCDLEYIFLEKPYYKNGC